MSTISLLVVPWFTPIIVYSEYTNQRGLKSDGGFWKAITDFQDQKELILESGGLVSVCSCCPTDNGIEYDITNTNPCDSSCLYNDNFYISGNPVNQVFITLKQNTITGGSMIRFQVNKIYNTCTQFVLEDPDINIPSREFHMHDIIQTDDCWEYIRAVYDEVNSNYVGLCVHLTEPI